MTFAFGAVNTSAPIIKQRKQGKYEERAKKKKEEKMKKKAEQKKMGFNPPDDSPDDPMLRRVGEGHAGYGERGRTH